MSAATPVCRSGLPRLEVCASLDAVPAEAWNRLVDDSTYPNVFRRHEWLGTWWKWFGRGRRMRLLLAYDDGGRLAGALPLCAAPRRLPLPGVARLRCVGTGGPTYPEYLGVIAHRDCLEPVVAALAEHLVSGGVGWSVLEFDDAAADDEATQRLLGQIRTRYPSLAAEGVLCRHLHLPDTYEALLGRLSGHGRQRKKAQVRKAKTEAGARLELLGSAAEIDAFFPEMRRLSTFSRQRKGQNAPFTDPAYAGFHREVMELAQAAGTLRIFRLVLQEQTAAFGYGFLYRHKFSYFQTGFAEGFEKFSPGDVLLQLMLEELIAQGATEFDFLRGEYWYKNRFADIERRTESVCVFRRRGPAWCSRWTRQRVLRPLKRAAVRAWSARRTSPSP